MSDYIKFNQERWNNVSRNKGNSFTIPLTTEEYKEAIENELDVSLTIGKSVPLEWFEKAKGTKLLGLACGGGQQGPIFAGKGYDTTIMDYSEEQLQKDRMVAQREQIELNTIQADMTQPFPFDSETFDIIFCPVSNAYIQDLENMYIESYRVLKPGGLLMVGYMNPWIYMYDGDDVWDYPDKELMLKYSLPYNSVELEKEGKVVINPEYGYEFSHTLETQIGNQLKAGFVMVDFYESKDFRNRLSKFGSDYLANLCLKL